jgi:hypothetical protein
MNDPVILVFYLYRWQIRIFAIRGSLKNKFTIFYKYIHFGQYTVLFENYRLYRKEYSTDSKYLFL